MANTKITTVTNQKFERFGQMDVELCDVVCSTDTTQYFTCHKIKNVKYAKAWFSSGNDTSYIVNIVCNSNDGTAGTSMGSVHLTIVTAAAGTEKITFEVYGFGS